MSMSLKSYSIKVENKLFSFLMWLPVNRAQLTPASVLVEFFLNNTNLTFLAVLYKNDIEGFQNQQK